MAAKVSKAARIRELLAEGKTTRDVADIIGCDPAYVRTAGRQRLNGAMSATEAKWRIAKYGSLQAYWTSCNERTREYRRDYYRNRRKLAASLRSGGIAV